MYVRKEFFVGEIMPVGFYLGGILAYIKINYSIGVFIQFHSIKKPLLMIHSYFCPSLTSIFWMLQSGQCGALQVANGNSDRSAFWDAIPACTSVPGHCSWVMDRGQQVYGEVDLG